MKLWLEGKDIDVRNARDTLRAALEQGLITDGNDWTRLHESRNFTSHTYDLAVAKQVYACVKQEGPPCLHPWKRPWPKSRDPLRPGRTLAGADGYDAPDFKLHSDIDLAIWAPGLDDAAYARLWDDLDSLPLYSGWIRCAWTGTSRRR